MRKLELKRFPGKCPKRNAVRNESNKLAHWQGIAGPWE